MLLAEREGHRRQRRALTPGFSNAALRTVTSVFYDSAYKVKADWSESFESSDEAIIDVQKWMNRITFVFYAVYYSGLKFHTGSIPSALLALVTI
ncbi:hypothetical protein APHAL10511_004162 [Amanita phalloides]|nr:hypothetical protein APHAL10511_004162 [Amanita phalloides]